MPDDWSPLQAWPTITLERLADAGVARVVMNRPE